MSDDLPQIRETFGDTVVTYDSPEELRSLIEHYLASPAERSEKGRRGRELVLAHHTFEHRVEELLGCIEERLKEPALRARVLPLEKELRLSGSGAPRGSSRGPGFTMPPSPAAETKR